jgi:hypothetical protein
MRIANQYSKQTNAPQRKQLYQFLYVSGTNSTVHGIILLYMISGCARTRCYYAARIVLGQKLRLVVFLSRSSPCLNGGLFCDPLGEFMGLSNPGLTQQPLTLTPGSPRAASSGQLLKGLLRKRTGRLRLRRPRMKLGLARQKDHYDLI